MFTIVSPKLLGDTKTVVLMYGWLGAEDKHLKKYANMYVDLDCTVVYGTTKVTNIMMRNEKGLRTFAMESVKKAAKIIRDMEKADENNRSTIPVVLHYFSNGGAFVADRLQRMIRATKDESGRSPRGGNDGGDLKDLMFIAHRLQNGFEVLDSAPAYLYKQIFFLALESALPNLVVRLLAKMCLRCILLWKNILILSGKPSDREEFWDGVTHSDICRRQLYLYSERDKLTDYKMVENLIEERKKMGIEILAHKFEDSEHVLHFRGYPEEYKALIAKVVDSVATVMVREANK